MNALKTRENQFFPANPFLMKYSCFRVMNISGYYTLVNLFRVTSIDWFFIMTKEEKPIPYHELPSNLSVITRPFLSIFIQIVLFNK